MVDLASVPASGSADFEYTVRTNLGTWETQIEANANEIIAARDGEADLDTRLDEIEDGTRLTDNTITEAKLALNNAPTDNYVLSWNAAAGKPEWKTPGSATDTGQVRTAAGESMLYLGEQIDDSTIVLDGSDLLSVKFDNSTIKNGASGLYVDSADGNNQIEFDTFALTFM